MNINYQLLKHFLIVLLSLFAAYQIFALASSIFARPKIHDLNFKPINQVMMQSSTQSVSPTLTTDSAQFDYSVIGYRAGTSRASIIVKRNNKSYVVQQGELLENKYKLISVGVDSAIFEYMGEQFQLTTKLKNEK